MKIKLASFLMMFLLLMNLNKLNPINLTLSFLLISFMVSLVALMSLNKWFFYVFILFYVGGMMIMFVYIVSLLNTEKFSNMETTPGLMGALSLFLMFNTLNMWPSQKFTLMNIYKAFESMASPFMALVLLVVLVAVVKLCDTWKGSLKSKINE